MNNEYLEKKIGEAIGLEKASQAAEVELSAKGLLGSGGISDKLQTIKTQDKNHQRSLQELSMSLSKSQGISLGRLDDTARNTEQKFSEIMKIYLGKDPDRLRGIRISKLSRSEQE